MNKHLEKEFEAVDKAKTHKKAKRQRSTQKMLQRWMKLWSPIGPRVQLSGVQRTDGSITEDPTQQAAALPEHWQKVFATQTISRKLTKGFLTSHQNPINCAALE